MMLKYHFVSPRAQPSRSAASLRLRSSDARASFTSSASDRFLLAGVEGDVESGEDLNEEGEAPFERRGRLESRESTGVEGEVDDREFLAEEPRCMNLFHVSIGVQGEGKGWLEGTFMVASREDIAFPAGLESVMLCDRQY